jgi:hypothetical protein
VGGDIIKVVTNESTQHRLALAVADHGVEFAFGTQRPLHRSDHLGDGAADVCGDSGILSQ